MRMRPAWICGAAVFCVAAAKEPDMRRIDACAFLRQDEIQQVLGRSVHPGERHDDGEVAPGGEPSYSSTCLWRVKTGDEVPPDPGSPVAGASFVIVNAIRWPVGEASARYLQSFREAAEDGTIDGDPDPVDIGDEALWWGDGVAFRKKENSVGVSVHLPGDRERERLLEETLSRIVARRL